MPAASPPSHSHSHSHSQSRADVALDMDMDVPPFPSPSTFSIIPDIYMLIARLNILQQQAQAQTQASTSQAQSQSQAQRQTQTQQSQSQTQGATQTQSHILPHGSTSQALAPPTSHHHPEPQPATHLQTGPPLDIKDLPAQVYKIRQRLGKARAAVAALPDVQRSVEEQASEIRRLEATVASLKTRLALLASIAGGGAGNGLLGGAGQGRGQEKRDAVMQGV